MRYELVLLAVAAVNAGCSTAARTPAKYRDDTAVLLDSRRSAITACYDRALHSDSAARGAVSVRFTVEEDTGRIKDITVDRVQTTASTPVVDCVTQTLEGLVLTPPDGRDGHATFVWDFVPPARGGA